MTNPKNATARQLGSTRAGKVKLLHSEAYQNRPYLQGKFNRSALPVPATVLQHLGIVPIGKVNHAGYFLLRCPFHNGGQEKHPSLNIHAVDGHYRCHACGTAGGDVLAFYIAVTGKGFKDAARDLGAWGAGV